MILEVYTDVQRNTIRSVQSTKKYNQKCTKNYEETMASIKRTKKEVQIPAEA